MEKNLPTMCRGVSVGKTSCGPSSSRGSLHDCLAVGEHSRAALGKLQQVLVAKCELCVSMGCFAFSIPIGPTSTINHFSRQERPLSLEGLEWVQAQFQISRHTEIRKTPSRSPPAPLAAPSALSSALQGLEKQSPMMIL